jgi:hypothetical protein
MSMTAFGQPDSVPWTREYGKFITNCFASPIVHQTKAEWNEAGKGVQLSWPPVNAVHVLRWHESENTNKVGRKGLIFDGFVTIHRDVNTFLDTSAKKNSEFVYSVITETSCGTSYGDQTQYGFSEEKKAYHHFITNLTIAPSARGPIPIPPRAERMNQQTNK